MAVRTELTVWCDECGQWTEVPGARTKTQARRKAATTLRFNPTTGTHELEGWVYKRAANGSMRDLCPSCAAQQAVKKEQE